MPYHVQVLRYGSPVPYVPLDLDARSLEDAVLVPYRDGRELFVGGGVVPVRGLVRITITWTEEALAEVVSAAGRADPSPVAYAARAARIASTGREVTDRFVAGPPGRPGPGRDGGPRRVFLVAGRWAAARRAMAEFLASLGIEVVEWDEAVVATGRGSRYPAEILDAGLARCRAVVVFMTPDDLSALHPALRLGSGEGTLSGQARPNVIFEAGMAWQRSRERTLIVTYGDLTMFSDLKGVDRVRFDGSAGARQEVVARLRAMGVELSDAGTRWLTAGRFPRRMRAVTAAELGLG